MADSAKTRATGYIAGYHPTRQGRLSDPLMFVVVDPLGGGPRISIACPVEREVPSDKVGEATTPDRLTGEARTREAALRLRDPGLKIDLVYARSGRGYIADHWAVAPGQEDRIAAAVAGARARRATTPAAQPPASEVRTT